MHYNVHGVFYTFCGHNRVDASIRSIRETGSSMPITVVEDPSTDQESSEYKKVCAKHDARYVRLPVHSHMSGCCHRAVMECDAPFAYVGSDDAFTPRGLLPAVERFLQSNKIASGSENRPTEQDQFCSKIAGIYLHHFDRADIIEMSRRGEIAELPDFQETDFFTGDGDWFWKHLDGRLPYGGWSEPSPPDKLSICSNVHGSAFVASRYWWDRVGGCAGVDSWQNDSVYSFRIGQWTDAFMVRLPWLPSVAHYGGAAATPHDPSGRWTDSMANLSREHGFAFRGTPPLLYEDGAFDDDGRGLIRHGHPLSQFELIEWGLKLRSDSLQRRYASCIDELSYSYRELCEPI